MPCVKFIGTGLLLAVAPFSAWFGGPVETTCPGCVVWIAGGVAFAADALLTALLFSPKLREWFIER